MDTLFTKAHFAAVRAAHQSLYDEIAQSHPSLIDGVVMCSRCGRSRKVDAAKCLREGWPKCCSATMGLKSSSADKERAK